MLITWVGLALAYFYGHPVGFYITTVAFGVYVLARIGRAIAERSALLSAPLNTGEAGG